MSDPRRALVIVAHPDDAEFLCAGSVARWTSEGWEVVYVLATSGDKGSHDEGMTTEKLAAPAMSAISMALKITLDLE